MNTTIKKKVLKSVNDFLKSVKSLNKELDL